MTGPPVLWHFPISHYNEKARWALDWKGIPHVRRALALSYVPRALWATGQVFAHDPVSAGTVLTTGMGAGARRAVRAVLPAFRAFYKLRHGIDDAAIAAAPARMRAGLDRIVAELGPSGHLVGDAFSVADLTAAALLSPIVLPPEFPYPPPEPRPRHFVALRASLEGHPAFRWVLETYRRHRGTSAAITG